MVSGNRGKLYENLVAVALKRMEFQGGLKLFYWKYPQGEEVDFVVQRDRQVSELIQVCADAQDPDTRQREMRALVKAGDRLTCDRLLILTREEEGEEEVEWFGMKGTIRLVPLWKWFLELSESE
jgi:hypothetical protein